MPVLHDLLPPTTTRVEENTRRTLNEDIRAETERSVRRYAGASKQEITRRLEELDREWDVERVWHFLSGLCSRRREPLRDHRQKEIR